MIKFIVLESQKQSVVVTAEPDETSPGHVDIKMDGIVVAFFSIDGKMYICTFENDDTEYHELKRKGVRFTTNNQESVSIEVVE